MSEKEKKKGGRGRGNTEVKLYVYARSKINSIPPSWNKNLKLGWTNSSVDKTACYKSINT